MLGNPIRGISFNSPSSIDTYRVKCSFCDYESWAKPITIKPEEIPLWKSHTCDFWCNYFNCWKPYLESGGNEFYVANNRHLMCFKCKKLDGSQTYSLRPFDKLPQNAEIYSNPGDFITTKTTKWYKNQNPNRFESKARLLNRAIRLCQPSFSAIRKTRNQERKQLHRLCCF